MSAAVCSVAMQPLQHANLYLYSAWAEWLFCFMKRQIGFQIVTLF